MACGMFREIHRYAYETKEMEGGGVGELSRWRQLCSVRGGEGEF